MAGEDFIAAENKRWRGESTSGEERMVGGGNNGRMVDEGEIDGGNVGKVE